MNAKKSTTMLIVAAVLASSPASFAQNATRGPTEAQTIAEIFAGQESNSPVALLLRAHLLEKQGRTSDAIKAYSRLLEQWPAETRWGRLGILRKVRCLLCQRPPDANAAKELLNETRSVEGDLSYQRERVLWEFLVESHNVADSCMRGNPLGFSEDIEAKLKNWPIPTHVQTEFARALSGLSEKVVSAKKESEGADFLRAVLGRVGNPNLHRTVIRELISMQLKAEKPADALIGARAYWLLSIEKPALLVDAIRHVTRCMKKLGASESEIEQYRLFQMHGNKAPDDESTVRPDPLKPFMNEHYSPLILIPQDVIDREKSEQMIARLYLMNGDLAHALPLLGRLIAKDETNAERRAETLGLIRVAFALHDGHINAVDRYERYVYRKSPTTQGSSKTEGPLNPLQELIRTRATTIPAVEPDSASDRHTNGSGNSDPREIRRNDDKPTGDRSKSAATQSSRDGRPG